MDLNNVETYAIFEEALRRLEELRAAGHPFEMWLEFDKEYLALLGVYTDSCYIIVWG